MRLKAGIGIFLIAAAAWAGVGSVISSFRMTTNSSPRAYGVYRDDRYVYGCLYTAGADYLRTYATTGSAVATVTLENMTSPRDADHSLLGSSYIDVFDIGTNQLKTYTHSGSFVRALALMDGTTAFAYLPGASRYYLGRNGNVYTYDLNQQGVSEFYAGGTIGGLAVTNVFNGRTGEYIILGRSGAPGLTHVYNAAGSVVGSFVVPGDGTWGGVVGKGYPGYGRTYWCTSLYNNGRWAFQIDIGGTGVAVAPASMGKIKAVYR